ncbi:MAG: hypothetical protein MJ025_07165 [Victivallaceae bacterium]|nr:hypothetical protein [Victivallaceae bacterium]
MKKTVAAAVAATSMLLCAESGFRFFNIVPCQIDQEAVAADMMAEYRDRTGNRDLLYCLSLHPEGRPAIDKVDRYIDSFCKFRDRLSGRDVRCGILVQSIIGHWPRVDKDIEPWQRSVDIDGRNVRFCVLDPRFQEYMREVGRKLAKAKPSFIMTDDDVRSYCPQLECFCPLHIAELNRRLGTKYTQQEVRGRVRNGRRGDRVYDAFLKLANEIPLTAVTMLRQGIDSVDPSIGGATCMAGRGQGMLEASRAFSGKGHEPMLRITNQMYCEPSPRDYFATTVLRTMGQVSQYREIPNLVEEADTFPHSLYSRSAVGLHAKTVASIFSGCNGAKLWFVNSSKNGIPVSRKYTDILAKYRGFYPALADALAGSEQDGVMIPLFRRPHLLHPVTCPSEQRYPLDSWVGSQFALYGVPFAGTTDYKLDRVYAIGGDESVDRLDDAEIRELLSRRVLVDGKAAVKLTKRGFSALMGCAAVMEPFKSTLEMTADGKTRFTNFKHPGTPLLRDLAPGAKTLTNLGFSPFGGSKDVEIVAPGSVCFDNELGGRVLVTAFDIDASPFVRLADGRKPFIRLCLDELSNGRFDFILEDDQPETLLIRRCKDESRIIGVFDTAYDPIDRVRIRCAAKPSEVLELREDGKWREIKFMFEDGILEIDRAMHCYDTLVLKAK